MAGGGRAQKNKAHKTKFSAKSQRTKHREGKEAVNGARPASGSTPQGYVAGAKAKRMLQNKQARNQKKVEYLNAKRASGGTAAPPKLLVLLGLSSEVNLSQIRQILAKACVTSDADQSIGGDDAMDVEGDASWHGVEGLSGAITLCSQKHKLRITIIDSQPNDILQTLETLKIADIVAMVAPANSVHHADAWGQECLTLARHQGLPPALGIIQGLSQLAPKKRAEAKKSAANFFSKEFPENFRTFGLDSSEDSQQILRYLSEHKLSAPNWRVQRPYLVAHGIEFVPDPSLPAVGSLLVSGHLRGRGLSVNQLVHLAGQGDFQLSKIDGPGDPAPLRLKTRLNDADMADSQTLPAVLAVVNPEVAEQVVVENSPDPLAGEQTWPTEEEMATAVSSRKGVKARVPKGTSSYQAAWYIGQSDDEGEDGDSEGEEEAAMDEGEGNGKGEEEEEEWEDVEVGGGTSEGFNSRATSVWGDDHAQILEGDEKMTDLEREEDVKRLKSLHQQDAEFPDEVDTPWDTPAKQRFAKYRGLKSFRTSPWDPRESLPLEYSRIFAFQNFKRTHKHALAQARRIDDCQVEGSVKVGSFIRVHLVNVPQHVAEKVILESNSMPAVVYGLLKHETKMTVLNFGIRKLDSCQDPIRSKEPLLFHCGFRRFTSLPIFSTDDLNLDKHKFERFLHAGRFSVASVFAPVMFPPSPLLAFKQQDGRIQLAAVGSLRDSNPDRIILKKIILTGYPLSVSKRKAVVKYMFHNPDDVRWFKPVEVYTKYGRRGRIKEPVGDKGNMKCIFDGVVQQRDTVCVSLFKRVYPKWPEVQ